MRFVNIPSSKLYALTRKVANGGNNLVAFRCQYKRRVLDMFHMDEITPVSTQNTDELDNPSSTGVWSTTCHTKTPGFFSSAPLLFRCWEVQLGHLYLCTGTIASRR